MNILLSIYKSKTEIDDQVVFCVGGEDAFFFNLLLKAGLKIVSLYISELTGYQSIVNNLYSSNRIEVTRRKK